MFRSNLVTVGHSYKTHKIIVYAANYWGLVLQLNQYMVQHLPKSDEGQYVYALVPKSCNSSGLYFVSHHTETA